MTKDSVPNVFTFLEFRLF